MNSVPRPDSLDTRERASMRLRNLLDDGEPHAGTGNVARLLAAVEPFEDREAALAPGITEPELPNGDLDDAAPRGAHLDGGVRRRVLHARCREAAAAPAAARLGLHPP